MSTTDIQTPMPDTSDLAGLLASLDCAIADMQQLAERMLDELRALESRDLDGLQQVVSEKHRLVTRLEAETAQQRHWIEAAGFSFTPDGIEQFIKRVDTNDQLATRWSTLIDHTRRCDQLNRDNARSIERDRRRVAVTLRLLNGEEAGTNTYDPQGRPTSSGQRGRSISQA